MTNNNKIMLIAATLIAVTLTSTTTTTMAFAQQLTEPEQDAALIAFSDAITQIVASITQLATALTQIQTDVTQLTDQVNNLDPTVNVNVDPTPLVINPPGFDSSKVPANLNLIPVAMSPDESTLYVATDNSGILLYADTLCGVSPTTPTNITTWIQFGKDTTVIHNDVGCSVGPGGFIFLATEDDANFKQGDILVLVSDTSFPYDFHQEVYREQTP